MNAWVKVPIAFEHMKLAGIPKPLMQESCVREYGFVFVTSTLSQAKDY